MCTPGGARLLNGCTSRVAWGSSPSEPKRGALLVNREGDMTPLVSFRLHHIGCTPRVVSAAPLLSDRLHLSCRIRCNPHVGSAPLVSPQPTAPPMSSTNLFPLILSPLILSPNAVSSHPVSFHPIPHSFPLSSCHSFPLSSCPPFLLPLILSPVDPLVSHGVSSHVPQSRGVGYAGAILQYCQRPASQVSDLLCASVCVCGLLCASVCV